MSWEVVLDEDGQMARVRWSEPGEGGSHLYVRHYPATMKHSAESEAKEMNAAGRSPFEWDCYRPAKKTEVILPVTPKPVAPVTVEEPLGFDFKCDSCKTIARIRHHDKKEAIEIARNIGWLIRGTGEFGPDDCPICKKNLEAACGRKIRSDGGYA